MVFYRGLNCRLACILSIAETLGVNHTEAYATLWPEKEFKDDVRYNIYVSKRVYDNLEALGIIIEQLDGDGITIEEGASRIRDGEYFIMGLDFIGIPWHPVYNYFHGYHFIYAVKESARSILCFDPVYEKMNIRMDAAELLPFAYEICRVRRIDACPRKADVAQEAASVLEGHPRIRSEITSRMLECEGNGRHNTTLLLKQINAMIDNRYLFQHFLHNCPDVPPQFKAMFEKPFISKWEAVRYGLYKASILNENLDVIGEVCSVFNNLIECEMDIAHEIINTSGGY